MRSKGFGRLPGESSIEVEPHETGVEPTKRLEAIANAKPQDARRAALGKKPDAMERHVERRLTDRICQHVANAPLDCVFDGAKKMQRQMHAVGSHPRRFRERLDRVAQPDGQAPNLLAGRIVDINCDE